MNFTDQFLAICQTAENHGLNTLTHLRALAVLTRYPEGITMGRLGELVGLSSASMTGLIDTLSRLRLVERVHQDHDRRSIWVRLTHQGEVMIHDILS